MKTEEFEATVRATYNGNIQVYQIKRNGQELTYKEVLNLWETDNAFIDFYISIFKKCGFSSYVWETPPVSTNSIDQAFEFVLIKTPEYTNRPDLFTFRAFFNSDSPNYGVVTFLNLGKDATLVVPSPYRDDSNYSNLAYFYREAPIEQQKAIWKVTASMLKQLISDQPIWTSVAGGGVAWLHIRLDNRPKYYRYPDYIVANKFER